MKRLTLFNALFIMTFLANAQEFKASLTLPETLAVFNGAYYDLSHIKQYQPEKVEVSSTLAPKTKAYLKENLIDGNLKSAWVEGEEDSGEGSIISITVGGNEAPAIIGIMPGFAYSKDIWQKNNRVKKIRIRMRKDPELENEEEIIDEFILEMLIDENGKVIQRMHYFDISSLYLQNMAYTEFAIVEFEILEVDDQGAKYNDTCISEIELYRKDDEFGSLNPEEYLKWQKTSGQ